MPGNIANTSPSFYLNSISSFSSLGDWGTCQAIQEKLKSKLAMSDEGDDLTTV